MTFQETRNILKIIMAAYPKQFAMNEITPELWHSLLQDLSFDVIQAAVKKYILQEKFPPTITEIRDKAQSILNKDMLLDGTLAWDIVLSAVRKYGYTRGQDAIQTLPSPIQQVVRAIGWQRLCGSTQPDVIRGQFFKMFDRVQQTHRDQEVLPQEFQKSLDRVFSHVLSKDENKDTE